MILAGLAFKASAAPFHMWTPDVYQGAPTPVTAFMSAATKTAALVVTAPRPRHRVPGAERRLDDRASPCSPRSRSRRATSPRSRSATVKRMLAYSSISHAGFMLMAIAANTELGGEALLYYLIPYSRDVGRRVRRRRRARARARGAGDARRRSPASAGSGRTTASRCGSSCSAMAGFPLTGGMFGKLFVFSAAYDAG